jgi:hypothetical protein
VADIFDQVATPAAPPSGGDIFDQVSASSSDKTPDIDYAHPAGATAPLNAPAAHPAVKMYEPDVTLWEGTGDTKINANPAMQRFAAGSEIHGEVPGGAAAGQGVVNTGKEIVGGANDVAKSAAMDFEHSGGNPLAPNLTGDAAKQRTNLALGGAAKMIAGGGTALIAVDAPQILEIGSAAFTGDAVAKVALAKIAASVGAGAGASAAGGAAADKLNFSPEAKSLVQSVAFFLPTLFGVAAGKAGFKGSVGLDSEGNVGAGVETPGGTKVAVRAGNGAVEGGVQRPGDVFPTTVRVGRPAPPPDPAQVLSSQTADLGTNAIMRAATVAQQARTVVAGGPPPPPPGPPMPDQMSDGVLSQQIVSNIAQAVHIAPLEQHAPLLMEAHGKLSEYIEKQGRIIGPDGKLQIAETPQQAAKLAQNIINNEVDRQSQAKEDAAKQQAEVAKQQEKAQADAAKEAEKAKADAEKPGANGEPSPADQQFQRVKTIIDGTTPKPGQHLDETIMRNLAVDRPTAHALIDRYAKEKGDEQLATVGSKKEPVVEESRATVDAQVGALKRGDINVVMLPEGSKYRPATPEGMKLMAVRGDAPGAGYYIYDPTKIQAATIREAAKAGTHGDLLGHVQPKAELDATKPTVVVQAQDKDGTPIQDSEVHHERVEAQVASMQERHPDATVVVKPTHQVIGERVAEHGDIFDEAEGHPADDYAKPAKEVGKSEEKETKVEKLPEPEAAESSPGPAATTKEVAKEETSKQAKGKRVAFTDRQGVEREGVISHAGDRITRIGKYDVAKKNIGEDRPELKPGQVGRMAVSELHLDPKRFQYKLGVGAEGVSDLLTGKKWNDDLAGVTSVWRDPADGKTYVVNGHHRATLAKQTKTGSLPVRMIDAENAGEARSIGALQNIAEGRGTALDAAKFFRDTGTTLEKLEEKGISLGEATANNGVALANLDTRLFDMVVQGKLGQGKGIAIGRETSDPAIQDAILKLIEKGGDRITDAAVGELARFAQTAPLRQETVASLFGDETRTESTALDKAQVSAYVLRELGAEKRAFGAVSSESRAKKLQTEGKNKIDVAGNAEKATDAEQAREVYLKLSARRGPIDDILNRAAEERSNANPSQVGAIDQRAYDDIRTAVSEALAGSDGPSSDRSKEVDDRPSNSTPGERAGTDSRQPELAGLEDDVARQKESAAEVKSETDKADAESSLATPKDDISKASGEMERESPLFRDSEASGQGGLFGGDLGTKNEVNSLKSLMDKYKRLGVDSWVAEHSNGVITLNSVKVPTEEQSRGIGTAFMNDLTRLADEQGKTISLTPSKDFGASSVARLKTFYKRFGFVENKGRNKEFRISDSMLRKPNGSDEVTYLNGALGFSADALKPLAEIKPVADAIAFLGDEADRVKVSRDLHNRLYDMASQDNAAVLRVVQMLKGMPGTAKDQQAIYHHLEDPKSATLTDEQQEILDGYLTPLIYQAEHDFQVVTEGGVPLENYVHRQARDRGGMIDRIMEKVKDKTPSIGIGGGRLTKTAPAQKHRTMMAIEDAKTGKRQVVSIKAGRVAVMKNGQAPEDIGGLRNGLTTVGAEVDEKMAPFVKRVTELRDEIAGAKDADKVEQLKDVQERIAELRKQMDTLDGIGNKVGNRKPDLFQKGTAIRSSEVTFNQRAAITKKLDPLLKTEEALKNGTAPMLAKNANKLMRARAELKGAEAFRDAALNELPPETFADKAWKDKNGTLHKITQATTKEIEANTNVRYYQNAAASVAVNYLAMDKARRAYEFLEEFKKSPEFLAGSHSIKSPGAIPKGWQATQLPQFRGYFFEPHIAEVLDAYAAKAAHNPGVLEQVGNFLRTSIFFNPLIHIPNLLNHWVVEKGVSGFANPLNYPTLTRSGMKAINAVIHQNKDFLEVLDHGAPLQSQQFETKQFADLFYKKMQEELEDPESSKTKELATALGMSPVNLVKAIYKFSGKATWYTNDIAFLQSTYEKQEKGMSLKDALTETAKHIPDYRLMTRIFDNPNLAKMMSNHNLTMFGAYHYGALKSYGQMVKSITGFNWTDAGTKNDAGEPTNAAGRTEGEEKLHGLDTLLMMGLVTFLIYPALDKLWKVFTGNDKAQMRRAGASTLIYNLAMMAKGEKTPEELAESIATPAVQTKALAEMVLNRDLRTGQRLYNPHAPAKQLAGQIGRQVARSVAPVSQGMDIAEGRTDVKRLMYSMVGVSFPLHGAEKLAAQITAERLSSLPPRDEDQIAHAIQRSRALHDHWSGDNAKLTALLHGKDYSSKEKAKIRKDALLPPIVYAVRGMEYEDAVRVYKAANAQQQHQLHALMSKKLARLVHEGKKPEEILGKGDDN